ncbi:hypothetical protein DPEC_G00095520 [Dallia pectoralis]|uniref:Uncharacterized protein n=1 Tax=Dallia pectoralis TaxID=75939 RepID=A0ACC2GVS3_DALPE|nr:hypothetical protein DPEC_G00095520 [Dallia pectoralis]
MFPTVETQNQVEHVPYSRETYNQVEHVPYSRETQNQVEHVPYSRETYNQVEHVPYSRDPCCHFILIYLIFCICKNQDTETVARGNSDSSVGIDSTDYCLKCYGNRTPQELFSTKNQDG